MVEILFALYQLDILTTKDYLLKRNMIRQHTNHCINRHDILTSQGKDV